MKPAGHLTVAVTVGLTMASFTGCQSPAVSPPVRDQSSTTWHPATHAHVGRVDRVEESGRHVLIRLSPYATTPPPVPGSLLQARGDDLSVHAELRTGQHREGPIIEAEILRGRPVIDDEIVSVPAP